MAGDLDMDGALYRELWHACAGPLTSVPREGEHVFYFPQGHLEQLEELTYQGLEQRVRYFDLPSKILCRVIKVRLLAEPETDEVYAQITLLPEPVLSENASQDPPFPEPRCAVLSLCKTLAASDLGINGVFSISGMDADGCLPPLHDSLIVSGYVPATAMSGISRNGSARERMEISAQFPSRTRMSLTHCRMEGVR